MQKGPSFYYFDLRKRHDINNDESTELFKQRFFETNWGEVEVYGNPNEVNKTSLHKFFVMCDDIFQKKNKKEKKLNIYKALQ